VNLPFPPLDHQIPLTRDSLVSRSLQVPLPSILTVCLRCLTLCFLHHFLGHHASGSIPRTRLFHAIFKGFLLQERGITPPLATLGAYPLYHRSLQGPLSLRPASRRKKSDIQSRAAIPMSKPIMTLPQKS
ncbi:hypothetical protein E2320_003763, partial [Naja naja]